jgi:hypothetical protein
VREDERLKSRVDAIGLKAAPAPERELAGGGRAFDWVAVALCAWLQGGGFLDGWAHHHGRVDASFFTPWHAMLYTGSLAVAGGLPATLAHHRAAGKSWRSAWRTTFRRPARSRTGRKWRLYQLSGARGVPFAV